MTINWKMSLVAITLGLDAALPAQTNVPYPYSAYITNISFNFSSVQHYGPVHVGDTWPATWASNNCIYTAYGDGYGFSGTSKSSWGICKVAGSLGDLTCSDVYYGPPNSGQGKVCFLLAVGSSNLYGMDALQNSGGNTALLTSTNNGASWSTNSWMFGGATNFALGPFLQFGEGYTGTRDNYIYLYGKYARLGTNLACLARVLPANINSPTLYQYVTNIDANNQAYWGYLSNAIAIWRDTVGVLDGFDVVYNPGIARYLMAETGLDAGCVAVYEAPEPWGPWRTVTFQTNWGGLTGGVEMTGFTFPTKFMSADGTSVGVIFAPYGTVETNWNDQLCTMTATLTLSQGPGLTAAAVMAGGQLVLTGNGGFAGAPYWVLSSTNVAAPLSSWTPALTNNFAGDGSFSNAISINPSNPQLFYLIKTP